MSDEKEELKRDKQAMVLALRDAGVKSFKGNSLRCPFHADEHPSANIRLNGSGFWKFHCHVCSIEEDVLGIMARNSNQSIGSIIKAVSPQLPEKRSEDEKVYPTIPDLLAQFFHVQGHWTYTNPDTGKTDMVTIRMKKGDGKTFVMAKPCKGGYQLGAPPQPWPILNRTRIKDADDVILVEGEGKVIRLHQLGLVATTAPGGARNVKNADWSPLSGKNVTIWRDNDVPGEQMQREVIECLERLPVPPKTIRAIRMDELGDLPVGGDVIDYLARYHDCPIAQQREIIDISLKFASDTGIDDHQEYLENVLSGRLVATDWKWKVLGDCTQALRPGTITMLNGDPGSGKSLMLLEAMWNWFANGVRVAIFELEDDRAFHLNRIFAQLCENVMHTDSRYMFNHPDLVRAKAVEFGALLKAIQPNIWDAPDNPPRIMEVAEWIENRAKDGYRVIIVDPITAALSEDKPWISDQKFVMSAKSTARKYDASVIIATHPRTGADGKRMDGMAGGASFSRFSQTVMRLEFFTEWVRAIVQDTDYFGSSEQEFNRVIHVQKARSGRGTGQRIAYNFNPNTLTFKELGGIKGDILK